MNKTLRISFSLKNTYRVNGILYTLKQIPLIKKLLPESLYQVRGLKIFANVVSVLMEIGSAFLGKFLYFLLMIVLAGSFYETERSAELFLHIYVFLTIIGVLIRTFLVDPSRDKYYAIVLMNMNAKEYTLVNFFYGRIKVFLAYSIFGVLFGMNAGVPLWQCILIPLFAVGIQTVSASREIKGKRQYRTQDGTNVELLLRWLFAGVFLAAAYLLPVYDVILPEQASVAIMVLFILLGAVSLPGILKYRNYRESYRAILLEYLNMSMGTQEALKEQSYGKISTDTSITSKKKGFEYLNELFIKRHKKILWKPAIVMTLAITLIMVALLIMVFIFEGVKIKVNDLLMNCLPWFLFIMYAINRGTGFTNALFINCDHSLLTYSFYKEPKYILKLFQIRAREIIKVNLVPAMVIGAGLALLLFASGGTNQPINYVVLVVSIPCLSIFFSIHYLTLYYLLQPYNAGTELKGGMYQIIMSATYMVCYFMIQVELPTLYFGIATIVFCILYCVIASILVYKLAPRTFKIRS